jgi:hypothetical protein
MATTEVLKVSLKDYKKQIDDLKASLLQLDASSEEYAKTTAQIKEMQDKLNSVMGLGKKDSDALAGSYNALVQEMAALKKEWKSTNDEAKRGELGAQILDINNKLKEMDASTGNFQRNVGAYEDAWKNAFNSIGGGALSTGTKFSALAKGGVKGLTAAFKSLWAALGPVGLIITAIVTTIKALTSGITSSEENTRKFAAAMAPLKGIMDGVQSVLQLVASGFVTLVGWLGKTIEKTVEFLSFIPGFDDLNEKIKTNTKIVGQNNKVQDDARKINKENAELEEQMSEYMATYSDRTKNMTVRLDALNKANDKRKQIAENNLKLAKEELELIRLQSINTDNDAETNDKLAEAEAKVARATAEVNKALRENNEALKNADEEQKRILSERKSSTLKNLETEASYYKQYEDEWLNSRLEQNEISAKLSKEEIANSKSLTEADKKAAYERIVTEKKIQDIKDNFAQNEAIRAESLAKIQKQLYDAEQFYGKGSKQYQELYLQREKRSNKSVESFAKLAAEAYGIEEDRVLKILDLEHYEEEQENKIANQKKVFAQERIKDLAEYYDTQASITVNGLQKTISEVDKYNAIVNEIERNLDGVDINLNDVINFDPIENGQVNEEKYKQFFQKLIDANVIFPDEDLASVQKRFADYLNSLEQAEQALADYHNNMSLIEPEIKNIQDHINTSIFGSTVNSDLEYELETTKQIWDNLYRHLGESQEEFDLRKLKSEQNYDNAQKKLQQQQMKNITMVAGATSNIFDTIASARQSDIQKQVEEGKLSEEEGKKQFERTKALQYSSTWINTLSAIAQIMADSSIPSYWVKVPLAAAQLAEGIATTQQIKNTQLGSADTSGSNGKGNVGVSTVNVTPLLDEARDTMAMTNLNYNMSQQSEQRVYVVESDIKQVGTRVDVREQATTF